MNDRLARNLVIGAAALTLAACSSGGVDSSSFVPTPTPTPSPTPTPTPVSPFYQPVAATESLEFDVVGGGIRIRWDNDSKAYEVMLPGKDWARISADGNNYAVAGSNKLIEFTGGGDYSYTGIASTINGNTFTSVAYGIATPSSDVPVAGSASYSAQFFGGGGVYSVGSSAGHFDFNFAAGTLAGYFDPIASTANDQDSYDLGRFDFVQTVFSGGQNFSGKLSQPGAPDGSFSGLLTGPAAQELMGQWELPFRDPVATDTTVNASGVFIGKKTP